LLPATPEEPPWPSSSVAPVAQPTPTSEVSANIKNVERVDEENLDRKGGSRMGVTLSHVCVGVFASIPAPISFLATV
jgi:hypothetical protein